VPFNCHHGQSLRQLARYHTAHKLSTGREQSKTRRQSSMQSVSESASQSVSQLPLSARYKRSIEIRPVPAISFSPRRVAPHEPFARTSGNSRLTLIVLENNCAIRCFYRTIEHPISIYLFFTFFSLFLYPYISFFFILFIFIFSFCQQN